MTIAPSSFDTSLSDAVFTARPRWGSFVAGRFVEGETEHFEVLEAASARPLAEVAAATKETVDAAVRDSRAAYENHWRDTSAKERGQMMRAVAQKVRDHLEELAEICAREVGKPKRDAMRVDLLSCHSSFDYYAGIAESVHGEILHQGPVEAHVDYEPYGVVAAILPFNWPPIHFSKKLAPALAVGNTVVIKPGEQAPLTVLRLVELANEILPPGVVNAVSGIGAGPALVAHPRVERVTFTGATITGRKVMAAAAENLTFTTLELGGKNALMVLDDADLDHAVLTAVEGMFYNQGEACTSTSRIVVDDRIYDEFARRFVEATARLKVGTPMDPTTDIGPLVDERQQQKVLAAIEGGRASGATLLYAGELPEGEEFETGFYVAPHVFGEVTSDMALAREEIFGPVASLMRCHGDDDAVRIANESDYGLTAAICTGDERRAAAMAPRLEVGMVFVNNYTRRNFIGSPFGGVKGSGFGREYAAETMHEFVRAKNVRYPSGKGQIVTWPPTGA